MSAQRRRGVPARIWRSKTITDNRGNPVVVPDHDGPYEVKVWQIPQRSARGEVPGQLDIDVVRIGFASDVVGVTLWSTVEMLGAKWDIVTPPEYHHGTRRHTRHYTVDLRQRP